MPIRDFKGAALSLPGLSRLHMMDTAAAGTTVTDFSPSNQAATFSGSGNSDHNFPHRRPTILRFQREDTFSLAARSVVLGNVPTAFGKSLSMAGAMMIRKFSGVPKGRPIFGWYGSGVDGGVVVLRVRNDGSVAFSNNASFVGEATSAAGVVREGFPFAYGLTFDNATGRVKVWIDGNLVIDQAGMSGVTVNTLGQWSIGSTGSAFVFSPLTNAALTEAGGSVTVTGGTWTDLIVPPNGVFTLVPSVNPNSTKLWLPGSMLFQYTGRSGNTLTGVTLATSDPEYSLQTGTIPSGTSIFPSLMPGGSTGATGPFALAYNTVWSDSDMQKLMLNTGLTVADRGASSGVFSRRKGWRNLRLPREMPKSAEHTNLQSGYMTQSQNGLHFFNTTDFAPNIWYVDDNTPTVPVVVHHNVGGNTFEFDTALDTWTYHVPIPPGLSDRPPVSTDWQLGGKGSDHECVIIHRDRGIAWEFWGIYYNTWASGSMLPQNDGKWHARWGGVTANLEDFPGHYSAQNFRWGTSASSIHMASGLVMIDELREGYIPHGLSIAMANNAIRATTFVWPAQRTDGGGTGPTTIPEGSIARLAKSVDVEALPMSRVGKVLAHAIQDYGMMLRDTGGGNPTTFYCEPPWRFMFENGYDPYSGKLIAVSSLQAALVAGGTVPAGSQQYVLVPFTAQGEARSLRGSSVTVTTDGTQKVSLSWTPINSDAILGYHVYRKLSADTIYRRLTTLPGRGTKVFVDTGSLSPGGPTWVAATPTDDPGVVTQVVPVAQTLFAGAQSYDLLNGFPWASLEWIDSTAYQSLAGKLRNHHVGRPG